MRPSPAELARLAADHLERAQRAVDVEDWTGAVLWTAMTAEVAVSALAIAAGEDPRNDHLRRSSLARRLYERGEVDDDLGALLIRLHTERKAAVYEGRVPDLRGRSWDDVLDAVRRLVERARAGTEAGPSSAAEG